MKKEEKMELTDLFRSRLSGAEMPVRPGEWERLQADLPLAAVPSEGHTLRLHRRPWPRVAAAASVLLLLGVAWAAFWWLTPRVEMELPAVAVATSAPTATIRHDGVEREEFITRPAAAQPAGRSSRPAASGLKPASLGADEAERGVVSVRLSITVSQLVGENPWERRTTLPSRYVLTADDVWQVADRSAPAAASTDEASPRRSSRWALKGGLGTSLPKGSDRMPLHLRVSGERALTDRLSLEAGLQYSCLPRRGSAALHTLALPVKLHLRLTPEADTELYASLGGAVEKCFAGADDHSFSAEPLQLSAIAGIGVRHRLSDRLALFAEPELTHHFGTRSTTRSLYKERPTNLSLLCGVRMNY